MTKKTYPHGRRGFANMDPQRQREIASEGGKTAHREGRAHTWSSEEAKAAGRKGAAARKANRLLAQGL